MQIKIEEGDCSDDIRKRKYLVLQFFKKTNYILRKLLIVHLNEKIEGEVGT